MRLAILGLALGAAPVAAASDVIGEEDHLELELGFLAGDRSLGVAPFSRTDPGSRPLAGLDEPFAAYPLRDALVVGPRVEARVVAPPLRVTLGWQRPYPDWQPIPTGREPDGAGAPTVTSVRGLTDDEWLLGLGVEAPTGLVVPTLDLVGAVHVVRAEVEADGRTTTWRSESFSLGPRAGLRVQVSDRTFLSASGELGLFGPRTWGAAVGLGVAAF